MGVTAAELAKCLNLSQGRISQLVSQGRLNGAFTGDGRSRRFDPGLAAQALKGGLHPGQMLGNGAQTKAAVERLIADDGGERLAGAARKLRSDTELPGNDDDRYALARTQKAEEEARRLRRMNAQEEGQFVLASEVERQISRLLGQELREFESLMRDAARKVADEMGVDFKVVRQILLAALRAHRATRSTEIAGAADAAPMSETETGADI